MSTNRINEIIREVQDLNRELTELRTVEHAHTILVEKELAFVGTRTRTLSITESLASVLPEMLHPGAFGKLPPLAASQSAGAFTSVPAMLLPVSQPLWLGRVWPGAAA